MSTETRGLQAVFAIPTHLTSAEAMAVVVNKWPGQTLKWYAIAVALLTMNRTGHRLIMTYPAWDKLFANDPALADVRKKMSFPARAKLPSWAIEDNNTDPVRLSPKEVRHRIVGCADIIFGTLNIPPPSNEAVQSVTAMLAGGSIVMMLNLATSVIGNTLKTAEDITAQKVLLVNAEQKIFRIGKVAEQEMDLLKQNHEAAMKSKEQQIASLIATAHRATLRDAA